MKCTFKHRTMLIQDNNFRELYEQIINETARIVKKSILKMDDYDSLNEDDLFFDRQQ